MLSAMLLGLVVGCCALSVHSIRLGRGRAGRNWASLAILLVFVCFGGQIATSFADVAAADPSEKSALLAGGIERAKTSWLTRSAFSAAALTTAYGWFAARRSRA